MKNAFTIVTLSALLSACALVQPGRDAGIGSVGDKTADTTADGTKVAATPPVVEADAPVVAVPARIEDPLPSVELSSDLLYRITRAEFEFRRGQWQGPYVTLMGAAQETRDPRLAQRASEMALAAKQGGEAMAAIRLWRELAPNSDEASQYFLGFVVLGDNLLEAEPIFAQRLAAAPVAARGIAMFQMQQLLARAKDKRAAFALSERVLAPYGAMIEVHLVLAQGAFAMGDTARATQEAQAALAIRPDSELALLTLAQMTSDPAALEQLLTAFLKKNPGAREVRLAYARMLVEQKKYEEGRAQFLVLLKAQPDNVTVLYALGVMAMQLNDPQAAEGYFKQFLASMAARPGDERDPSKVLMILSQIAEERGDTKAALEWLDKVDGSDPRPYFVARIRRAQLMARHGDLDGARTVLADMKTGDADEQAQIFLTDAQLLRDGGYADTAFTVLQNAVKRFPGNTELLYDFALAAEKVGQLDMMEASLRQVMQQSPDNHHAYNALGYSLAERNIRLQEAYTLIDKALKMAPGDPFIMDSMGWVQFRLGNLDEAESLLRRAYALRSDPEIAVHLGEVLWEKGDKTDAQNLWREAKAKDPKNDALKSTLARFNLSL